MLSRITHLLGYKKQVVVNFFPVDYGYTAMHLKGTKGSLIVDDLSREALATVWQGGATFLTTSLEAAVLFVLGLSCIYLIAHGVRYLGETYGHRDEPTPGDPLTGKKERDSGVGTE